MILFRAVKGRVEEKIFSFLVANGMVTWPPGESPAWQHVRLDWWLILSAIASGGITICSFLWLLSGGYWQGIACLGLGWLGWLDYRRRRDELVCRRNLEFHIATQLRELGATPCYVRVGRNKELDVTAQFTQLGTIGVSTSELRKALSAKSDHICHYFNAQSSLPCAVHPSKLNEGLCNESCPDFKPR